MGFDWDPQTVDATDTYLASLSIHPPLVPQDRCDDRGAEETGINRCAHEKPATARGGAASRSGAACNYMQSFTEITCNYRCISDAT